MFLFPLVFMCLRIECLVSIKSTNVATSCLFLVQEDCFLGNILVTISILAYFVLTWFSNHFPNYTVAFIWSHVFGDLTNPNQIITLLPSVLLTCCLVPATFPKISFLLSPETILMKMVEPNSKFTVWKTKPKS